jgi:pimeloyl-ACP methyl ester carboxylesterase
MKLWSMKKTANEERVRSTDGVSIAYATFGNGKDLIIFIHAWCCDRTYWQKQINHFSKKYTVVTIDLGGHGRSGSSRDNWTVSALANDLISVIRELKYRHLFLVGHSLGGIVALVAAAKMRSRALRLVLVDALLNKFWPMDEKTVNEMLHPFRQNFKAQMKKWVKENMFTQHSKPLLIKEISSGMANANQEVAIPLFKDLMTRNYTSEISKLKRRRIIGHLLNSDSDETDKGSLKKMGFKIHIIPSTGHFIMMERPIRFNRTVEEFLH